ncbi:MAG: hypothetical protein JWQ88_2119 [Rhodoferax sp.]|nr:hypothetical protein [Rhodoferax sp.]
MTAVDALTVAILQALVEAPEGLSSARLGKRLGQGASVLLRRLNLLSEAAIGGHSGPGLVRVESLDGRWMVSITAAGRAALEAAAREGNPHADT